MASTCAAGSAAPGAGTAGVDALGAAHACPAADVARLLNCDPERGLSVAEAEQRLATAGANVVGRGERTSAVRIAVRQFADPLVLLLVGAAVVSVAIGETLDGVVISAILVVNALLGFLQESGAEQAILALRDAVEPTATVRRDARRLVIRSAAVVPGDVVVVEEGARVPADARLVVAGGLAVNESLLTGEPVPVDKAVEPVWRDAPVAERTSMVYAGTAVTRGYALAVVTAIGAATEVGRIATLAGAAKPPPTPMQRRLGRLSRQLVGAGLGITLVLAAAMLGRGTEGHEAFLIGVSVAVAAVPEGLAATITIALADGARRMAARRAIVRHLAAVETIGSATVIAADKTGTLTTNSLRVAAVHSVAGSNTDAVLRAGALATAAGAGAAAGQAGEVADPVDAAILTAAAAAGGGRPAPAPVALVPFDPERKRLTAAYPDGDGLRVVVKGAPEVLMARSRQPEHELDDLRAANSRFAARAHRVLAVGQTVHQEAPLEADGLDERVEVMGLVALEDPVRAGATESVGRAHTAGIRVVMLTGDQPATAAAVAAELGIPCRDPISGSQLAGADDGQLAEIVRDHNVFARFTPADKLRLVTALQALDEVVVVTGDGVNDTPALRQADVGVAMGRSGTEAAREAADIVLTDDAFSTIMAGIEEGRRIAQNMRAFVSFLLSANAGEVLLFTAATLIAGVAPMTVVQVLTVNLLTDGLPALALTRDPLAPGTMRRPANGDGLLAVGSLRLLGLVSVMVAAAAGAAYVVGGTDATPAARTMAYATLSLAELAVVFSVRVPDGAAWRAPRNGALTAAVLASAGLLAASVYAPGANTILGTVPISASQAAAVLGLALLPLIVAEAWKQRTRVIAPRA